MLFQFSDASLINTWKSHGVKSVRIRSYAGPHFSRIQTEYGDILRIFPYSVRIRENAGKMRTRTTPNMETFYAVSVSWVQSVWLSNYNAPFFVALGLKQKWKNQVLNKALWPPVNQIFKTWDMGPCPWSNLKTLSSFDL